MAVRQRWDTCGISNAKTITVKVRAVTTGAVVAGLVVGAVALGRRIAEPDWES